MAVKTKKEKFEKNKLERCKRILNFGKFKIKQ